MAMPPDPQTAKAPGLLVSAFQARCPQCGQASMFSGWIIFRENCPVCGLDYGCYNVGDGPAAFLTLIIGAVVCIMALALEFAVHPPFWLHLFIWPLVIVAMVIALLRLSKAALLIEEHRKDFREGRLADGEHEER